LRATTSYGNDTTSSSTTGIQSIPRIHSKRLIVLASDPTISGEYWKNVTEYEKKKLQMMRNRPKRSNRLKNKKVRGKVYVKATMIGDSGVGKVG